ncbi:MAG: hypothetical protein WAW96_16785 [Alphaproteobacteria bacterium]
MSHSAAFDKFARSMIIDYSKWHDGEGYDLKALRAIPEGERDEVERLLIERNNEDWRDVEALGALGTPKAKEMVRKALTAHNHQARLEATKWIKDDPDGAAQRDAVVCEAIRTAQSYGGLSQAMDQAAWHPTLKTTDALFRAALERSGENALNAAAALLYIYKITEDTLGWSERPFLLRFLDGGGAPREQVFRELCARCGVDPAKYL